MPYEQSAPAGGYESCIQDTYHKFPTVRTVTVESERLRVACLVALVSRTRLCEVAAQGGSLTACFVVPHPPGPVLSRIGDSELGLTRPALGADYYLTSLTSVKHREDHFSKR